MDAVSPDSAAAVERSFEITIDGTTYPLDRHRVTGEVLRGLVPVPADRDLWREVPGPHDDQLIRPEQTYTVLNGAQFYTAPSTINPGSF